MHLKFNHFSPGVVGRYPVFMLSQKYQQKAWLLYTPGTIVFRLLHRFIISHVSPTIVVLSNVLMECASLSDSWRRTRLRKNMAVRVDAPGGKKINQSRLYRRGSHSYDSGIFLSCVTGATVVTQTLLAKAQVKFYEDIQYMNTVFYWVH